MPANEKYTVSFYTNCYEADWEHLLKKGRLQEMISRCSYPFTLRNLIINNVKDRKLVESYAQKAKDENIIDNFYFTADHIQAVLKKFSISRKSFKLDGFDGFWYSTSPLTALYLCTTNYILYFTADCMLAEQYKENWINESIKKLLAPKIFCVTPLWDYYDKSLSPFNKEDGTFFYDDGLSDQVFLMDMETVAAIDYNEYNPRSEYFPIYGGNPIERRLFSYMNNHDYKRCILKRIIYLHEKLENPAYIPETKKNIRRKKLLYFIARAKRKLRSKNLFVKALLR